jgi:hypothetical protein
MFHRCPVCIEHPKDCFRICVKCKDHLTLLCPECEHSRSASRRNTCSKQQAAIIDDARELCFYCAAQEHNCSASRCGPAEDGCILSQPPKCDCKAEARRAGREVRSLVSLQKVWETLGPTKTKWAGAIQVKPARDHLICVDCAARERIVIDMFRG